MDFTSHFTLPTVHPKPCDPALIHYLSLIPVRVWVWAREPPLSYKSPTVCGLTLAAVKPGAENVGMWGSQSIPICAKLRDLVWLNPFNTLAAFSMTCYMFYTLCVIQLSPEGMKDYSKENSTLKHIKCLHCNTVFVMCSAILVLICLTWCCILVTYSYNNGKKSTSSNKAKKTKPCQVSV